MMEGNKRANPRALLLFGAPCSGKTTFGEKFAKKFGLTFYDLDELKNTNGFSDDVMLLIVEQILRTGQTVLLEGCLDTEKDRITMRNLLRKYGYEPSLVWFQTDVATIKQRLRFCTKKKSEAKSLYDNAVARLEAPAENEKPIVLSGKHTFDTQAKHVIAGLADL